MAGCSKPRFKRDEALGSAAEEHVVGLLRSMGLTTERNASREMSERARYDLKSDFFGVELLTEVKFDLMERQTGNLAIEYYNVASAKKSGIDCTGAHLWVHVLCPMSAYACPVAVLRNYIERVKPVRDIPCGGDNNAAMKLYRSKTILEEIFRPFEDLRVGHLAFILGGPFMEAWCAAQS
jgi:hypothetical protein